MSVVRSKHTNTFKPFLAALSFFTFSPESRTEKYTFYRRREKSALIMMAIVTVLFPIYCGSYIRCVFINIWNDQCSAFNYSVPMLLLNSAVNPLAYAFFKRDIKNEIKAFFRFVTLRRDKVEPSRKAGLVGPSSAL